LLSIYKPEHVAEPHAPLASALEKVNCVHKSTTASNVYDVARDVFGSHSDSRGYGEAIMEQLIYDNILMLSGLELLLPAANCGSK
jgi:hypothetical protein